MPYQHLGDARVLTLIAPEGGVTAGLPYLYEDTVVIATATRAAGVQYEGLIRGHVVVPKTVAQAWAIGDAIAFDSATALFNNIGTGIACGIAATVAINPSTTGQIVLGGGGSGNGSGGLPAGLTFVSPCLTVGTDTDNQVEVCGSAAGNPVTVGATTAVPLGLVMFEDSGGHSPVVVTHRPADIPNIVTDILSGNGASFVVADRGSDPSFVMFGYNGSAPTMVNQVTGGMPNAHVPTLDGQEILHWEFVVEGSGGLSEAIGTMTVTAEKSGGTYGTTWDMTAKDVTGGNGDFLAFDAALFMTNIGRPLAGDTVVLRGDGASTVGTMTVGTRTGTPVAMAAFDSGGKLVEVTGASGTFTTVDLKTVTVVNGIITSIVP